MSSLFDSLPTQQNPKKGPHWETHLYTYAVALTQGIKIRPDNLAGIKAKAVKEQGLGTVLLLELDPQYFIKTGGLITPQIARAKALSAGEQP